MTIRVAVVGATGRMGALVSRIIEESDDFELAAGIGSKGELADILDADAVVDVSLPAASPRVVDFAVEHGLDVLVGTSGWTSERIAAVEAKVAAKAAAGSEVGVIIVPNFSLGSVLATRFAATAARFFDSIEVIEAHGSSKIDSPSGTAIRTAELMAAERTAAGQGLVAAPHTDQRARGEQVAGIPVHSIRLQGVVAKQDVLFGGTGEVLTLSHETLSPAAYEAGILLALRALPTASGVTVGLDSLLGFGES
ncbi:4-hydroxy-tetrahydrodipicolinate reductase [Leifsonia bigeumensis]|uniref:4-hydroxy-tetrahydrodipicolinate reductase n=1 Tax=Leifsonella bigeumensis TaxID=433643 RepID=A0ABP7FM40_9MICO